MAGVRVGLREDGVQAGDRRVRDEPLRAVEDVLVAVAARRRPHRCGVGARPGLGERVRGQHLAGGEAREEPRPLLLRPGELEPERAELLHGEDQPARRADLRDLLDRDEREERPGSRAAVLLVEEEPEDAVLAEELDDVPRELVRLVDLGGARRDALARDRPHELADLELLVGQRLPGHARILGRCPAAEASAGCARVPASRSRRRRREQASEPQDWSPGAFFVVRRARRWTG